MIKSFLKIILIIIFLIGILTSCAVKKHVPENEHLLNKYTIQFENKYPETTQSVLKPFLKPKPNKKILGWRSKLYFYYRNENKPTKFNAWLDRSFGEPPEFYYEEDIERTALRMEQHLGNIGFFNSIIDYKVEFGDKTADITYNVRPAPPYHIDEIKYEISDTVLAGYFNESIKKTLIKKGDIYNAYTFDDERDRITNYLRNNGYYYFNRNYIQYLVDSNYTNHSMIVTLKINNTMITKKDGSSSFSNKPHDRYYIKNVTVIPEYDPTVNLPFDTIEHSIQFWHDETDHKYQFLYNQKPRIKPSAFNSAIKIKSDKAFSATDLQSTYSKLFNYRIIRTAKISFDTTDAGKSEDGTYKYINSQILMQNSKRNSFSIEGFGTNSSGDLGVSGKLTFLNKNISKRADILRIRLIGGFEAQAVGNVEGGSSGVFNTFEAGIDGTIFFPRFLFPYRLKSFNEKYSPVTNVTFGFNYQVRQNYTRSITNLEFGYSWNKTVQQRHIVTPFNTNFIKIFPTPEFQEILDKEENKALKEQYSDQIIFGLSYSYIFNNQNLSALQHHQFFRFNLETSGNLLYAINSLANSKKSEEGYYQIFGVRYSQYIRGSVDYRHYFYFDNKNNSFAVRFFLGSAIPYENSEEIPYTKGFYAGGANGMRGWGFKTLGPGAFQGEGNYEKIGEIQIEVNAELRFPIYQFFKGALFIDVGNIWTYRESTVYPGGVFKFDSFYKQFAVDGGVGLRFDFNFFLFRIDFALPFRDPAYPSDERWRLQYLQFNDFIANFGIGYPF